MLDKFTDELQEVHRVNKETTDKLSESKDLVVCFFFLTQILSWLMHTSIKQSGL